MASCKSEQTVARANTSSAPDALEVASALGNIFGETSLKLGIFMFFIARATAPMLPGWVVPTSTILILDSTSCFGKKVLV
jgi:hypothetical protein